MNVLIIGDSWGTGVNLERRLLEHKHTVFNKSIYGGSNIDTLRNGIGLQVAVRHLFKMDLIIFFVTEYGRDLNRYYHQLPKDVRPNTYYDALEGIHSLTLENVYTLKNEAPNAKWAIIGGQAPLYRQEDWQFANFIIPNYREELLKTTIPSSHILSFYEHYFNEFKTLFDLDTREVELAKIQIILDKTQHRNDVFQDTVHPNLETEMLLIDRILGHIVN